MIIITFRDESAAQVSSKYQESESVKKLASPLMDLFALYAGQLSTSLTDIQREITFTQTVSVYSAD